MSLFGVPLGVPLFTSLGGLALTVIGTIVRAGIAESIRYVYVSTILIPVFLTAALVFQNPTMRKCMFIVALGITLGGTISRAATEVNSDLTDDEQKAGAGLVLVGIIIAWVGHLDVGKIREKQSSIFGGVSNAVAWFAIGLSLLGAILFWAYDDFENEGGSILAGFSAAIVAIVFFFAWFLEDRIMGWATAFLVGLLWPSVFVALIVDEDDLFLVAGLFTWLAFTLFALLLLFSAEGANLGGMLDNFKKSLAVSFGIPIWGIVACGGVVVLGSILADAQSKLQEWLLAASFFTVLALLVGVLQTGDRRHILILVATGLFMRVIGLFDSMDGVIFQAHASDESDNSKRAGGYALVALALVVGFILQAPLERLRTTFAGCVEFKRLGFGIVVLGAVAFNAVGVFLLWGFADKNDSSSDVDVASVILFSSFFFLFSALICPFESALYANLLWNAFVQVALFSFMLTISQFSQVLKDSDTGVTGYLFAWISHVLFATAITLKLYWTDGGEGATAAGEGAPASSTAVGSNQHVPPPAAAPAGESSAQWTTNSGPNEDPAGGPTSSNNLPPGWEQHENEQGIPYYFNAGTGETRWDPPM